MLLLVVWMRVLRVVLVRFEHFSVSPRREDWELPIEVLREKCVSVF